MRQHAKQSGLDDNGIQHVELEFLTDWCVDGATIGFEFLASAMIDNWNDAVELVELADARNGGLIIDIVHMAMLGIPHEVINRLPHRYLISVELNDGALPGSPRFDPSRERRFCGEGDFDIRGFNKAVTQTGYSGPWAVEVFSEELVDWPLDKLNTTAYQTTVAQFQD